MNTFEIDFETILPERILPMPFTLFHFGPGVAFHSAAPRYVSFLAFFATNVLVDVEALYYLVSGQSPVHRFFHSPIGVSMVVACTVVAFAVARKLAAVVPLPDLFGWKQLTYRPVAVGAALGGYSHIVFDSIMHTDMRPLAPFSDNNPFLHALSLSSLHWICISTGLVGLVVLGVRMKTTR